MQYVNEVTLNLTAKNTEFYKWNIADKIIYIKNLQVFSHKNTNIRKLNVRQLKKMQKAYTPYTYHKNDKYLFIIVSQDNALIFEFDEFGNKQCFYDILPDEKNTLIDNYLIFNEL